MIARLVGLLLLLVAAPAPATPVPFADTLPWDRVQGADPGDWAEYAMRVGDHPVGPWLRFLVVGPGAEGGTWLEVWISQRPGSATQAFRILVDERGRALRVIGRLLGGPSRDLPLPDATAEVGAPAARADYLPLGAEPVQTGAGVLQATRLEAREGPRWVARAWVAPEVPVFGLARMDLASGAGLELSGWGRGGRGVVDLPAAGSAPARPSRPLR